MLEPAIPPPTMTTRARSLTAVAPRVPPSALAHVLVDAAARAQRQVDVAVGVDPAPVPRPRVPPRHDGAARVHEADPRREPVHAPLADVEDPVAVDRDVEGPPEVGPDREESPVGGEHLDAVVLAIADVDRAGSVDHEAVG